MSFLAIAWQVYEEQVMADQAIEEEEDPSRDLVAFRHLDPLTVRVQEPELLEIPTKAPTSVGVVEEDGIQGKIAKGVEVKASSLSTIHPLEIHPAGGTAVCWNDSVIQDDGIPGALATLRVCQRIHPKFNYMGVLGIVKAEIWENGVCAAVIEAAVSIE